MFRALINVVRRLLHVSHRGERSPLSSGGLESRVANVLIAEDDLIMADMVEMVLVTAGYSVCGIARTVAAAVALAEVHKPDFAVIDLRLANGGLGTAIAAASDALADTGILYATGNASAVMLAGAVGHACLAKPYSFPDLIRSLALVAEMKATGTAKPPFPRGFRILPAASVNYVAEPANG